MTMMHRAVKGRLGRLPAAPAAWHLSPMPMRTHGADLRPPRSLRWGAAGLVLLLHLLVAAVLLRAFAPDLAAGVIGSTTRAFDVPLAPPPEPEPQPTASPTRPNARPHVQSAAAPEGKRAAPQGADVPRATVVPMRTPAPASAGRDDGAGSGQAGAGPGAGGQGAGFGAGDNGSGSGGGGGVDLSAKPEKIAGDINSAHDYPAATRDLRLGHEVVIVLRVGADGKARACRIAKPSPDAEADGITCRLAMERFRFRAARDAAGRAVEGDYGWRQRWFLKGQDGAR